MTPAWTGYFADPHVMRTDRGFFAYGTDGPDDAIRKQTGRVFPVLYSPDLEHWQFVGGALKVPAGLANQHFWAPEVCERDGIFYLYYSAGAEEGESQRLRVALADRPEGPFEDAGALIVPSEPFSIDADPFRDPKTGDWYLFYARDFLDGDRPGTGIALAKLAPDLVSAQEDLGSVFRAQADWQIYERNRFWYGRAWRAWHTVEGPFCVCREGRYWLFYSGGLWKGRDYGIGVAVAESLTGPYSDAAVESGPAVIRTSERHRGPGHNSVVVGLDGVDRICFHAWDAEYSKRQMYLAAMTWSSDGPRLAR